MSLDQYIPSRGISQRIEAQGLSVFVACPAEESDDSVEERTGKAMDHGCVFLQQQAYIDMDDSGFIGSYDYMIRFDEKNNTNHDSEVAFMLLKRMPDGTYKTKYDCIADKYIKNIEVGRILYDIAADVAMFDAARKAVKRLSMQPRGYNPAEIAKWIIDMHSNQVMTLGGVTVKSQPENEKPFQKYEAMLAILAACGYVNLTGSDMFQRAVKCGRAIDVQTDMREAYTEHEKRIQTRTAAKQKRRDERRKAGDLSDEEY